MRAKLFDAHNQFLDDHDTPDASPTIKLTRRSRPSNPLDARPPVEVDTFRLVDTDETGALIYRRIEE